MVLPVPSFERKSAESNFRRIAFYDITARTKAEEALRDSDRRKNEFLATLVERADQHERWVKRVSLHSKNGFLPCGSGVWSSATIIDEI